MDKGYIEIEYNYYEKIVSQVAESNNILMNLNKDEFNKVYDYYKFTKIPIYEDSISKFEYKAFEDNCLVEFFGVVDEWFYVSYSFSPTSKSDGLKSDNRLFRMFQAEFQKYYKCDQFDGLLNCIKYLKKTYE